MIILIWFLLLLCNTACILNSESEMLVSFAFICLSSGTQSLLIMGGRCKGFLSFTTQLVDCDPEVINFDNSQNIDKCSLYGKIPQNVRIGGMVGNTFLSCGVGITISYSDKCHKLCSTTPVATMRKKRAGAASVAVKNKLWITGGLDENGDILKSTEFVDPASGSTELGPDLPKPSQWHCIVMVDSTTAMLIGDYTGDDKASWFYNFDQPGKSWVPGPELNEGRWGYSCGVITDSANDGKTLVIAAGGLYRKSTEIFVVGSQKWIRGPDLPYNIGSAAGVTTPDGKNFLFIGGYNDDTEQKEDSVYKLQCYNLNCEWTKMDQKLRFARRNFVASFVPDSLLNCL